MPRGRGLRRAGDQGWGGSRRRARSTRDSVTSTVKSDGGACLTGSHQIRGHVTHQDGRITFRQAFNRIVQAIAADKGALIFAGIADASDDAEKVASDHGFFVVQLLNSPEEQVWMSKCRCDWWTETQQLLQRL